MIEPYSQMARLSKESLCNGILDRHDFIQNEELMLAMARAHPNGRLLNQALRRSTMEDILAHHPHVTRVFWNHHPELFEAYIEVRKDGDHTIYSPLLRI